MHPRYHAILVTVFFRGRSISRMVHAFWENGKAHVPIKLLEAMAAELGCQDGQTYSHG